MPRSPSHDSWDHDNLRGLGVKLLQSLDRFPRIDTESRRAPGALPGKDPFGFANRGPRFCITLQGALFIPTQALIPTL
jgi:hypothetical protein